MDSMMWTFFLSLSTNMWADSDEDVFDSPFENHLTVDDAVWRKIIDYLPSHGFNSVLIDLGDAIQYETHPEIAISGAWSKEKMREELNYMRALGLNPIPKLNFSTCHDAWLKDYSRMVSTPEYYAVCKDLITEVAELFDYPSHFHLGMDEEDAQTQRFYQLACMRQGSLWWHDCYYFFDICEKLGMRPWVWADKGWNDPEDYMKRMPKSVLQSNWWYGRMIKHADGSMEPKQFEYYLKLDQAGFDQIPTCSTLCHTRNTRETMELGKTRLSPQHLQGYMTTPWIFTTQGDTFGLLYAADRFYEAKSMYYFEEN